MSDKINLKIGCSGFYNAHWKNVFYPDKLAKTKWLDFYAQQFNSIEINSTFYKFPNVTTLKKWSEKTPENFLFSIKVPKIITHVKRFIDCQEVMNNFYTICEEGLNTKLGCLLFQLPPTITYSEEKLERILSYLKPGFTNVVEFRHISWWNTEIYQKLKEHNVIFCSVNHPTMPNTIISATDKLYIRLHGNPEIFYSSYSEEFLKKLHDYILQKKEITDAFIYFNNTASTAGVLNAQYFQKLKA